VVKNFCDFCDFLRPFGSRSALATLCLQRMRAELERCGTKNKNLRENKIRKIREIRVQKEKTYRSVFNK